MIPIRIQIAYLKKSLIYKKWNDKTFMVCYNRMSLEYQKPKKLEVLDEI